MALGKTIQIRLVLEAVHINRAITERQVRRHIVGEFDQLDLIPFRFQLRLDGVIHHIAEITDRGTDDDLRFGRIHGQGGQRQAGGDQAGGQQQAGFHSRTPCLRGEVHPVFLMLIISFLSLWTFSHLNGFMDNLAERRRDAKFNFWDWLAILWISHAQLEAMRQCSA